MSTEIEIEIEIEFEIVARPARGFRRAGLFHPPEPVIHPAARFTAAELAALKAETQLVVREIAPAAPAEKKPEPPKAGGNGGGAKPAGGAKK